MRSRQPNSSRGSIPGENSTSTASEVTLPEPWKVEFVGVANGEKIGRYLRRATVLPRLGILALELAESSAAADVWPFDRPPSAEVAMPAVK